MLCSAERQNQHISATEWHARRLDVSSSDAVVQTTSRLHTRPRGRTDASGERQSEQCSREATPESGARRTWTDRDTVQVDAVHVNVNEERQGGGSGSRPDKGKGCKGGKGKSKKGGKGREER